MTSIQPDVVNKLPRNSTTYAAYINTKSEEEAIRHIETKLENMLSECVAYCAASCDNRCLMYLRFQVPVSENYVKETIGHEPTVKCLKSKKMRKMWLGSLASQANARLERKFGEYEHSIISFENDLKMWLLSAKTVDVFDPFIVRYAGCFSYIKACFEKHIVNRFEKNICTK